ncbi:hypothetical protein AB0D67_08655 [Streptosporangium sp. NPDC048047]|uniref:hypothetical protein n=1 Tax=Streptosporangium sp. NPDC048047 TaxID=3155748 RepID=UPI0034387D8F
MPPGPWKCRCHGSPSCRWSSGRARVSSSRALTCRAAASMWIARWDRQQEGYLPDRETECAFAGERPEDWRQWWEAVAADPGLAALDAARATAGAGHHGSESSLLSEHAGALRDAGFTEVGTLWQRGHNRLVCAVRG